MRSFWFRINSVHYLLFTVRWFITVSISLPKLRKFYREMDAYRRNLGPRLLDLAAWIANLRMSMNLSKVALIYFSEIVSKIYSSEMWWHQFMKLVNIIVNDDIQSVVLSRMVPINQLQSKRYCAAILIAIFYSARKPLVNNKRVINDFNFPISLCGTPSRPESSPYVWVESVLNESSLGQKECFTTTRSLLAVRSRENLCWTHLKLASFRKIAEVPG